MQSIILKIATLTTFLFFIFACSQPAYQNSNNPFNLPDLEDGQSQTHATSKTIIAESGKFEVVTTDIRENTLYITAASTVDADSIAAYIRLRVKDEVGNILTKGPGGWVMKQEYTWGKRMYMTIELPLPAPGMITIEGLEKINISGIIYDNSTTLTMQIPEKSPPQVTAIDIDIRQLHDADGTWHDDFEAEGFVTLDRTADITGELYALDDKFNQIPGQLVGFDLKGFKSGRVSGLYNIPHNNRLVNCVLKIYYKGELISEKMVRKYPEINQLPPKVTAINIELLQEFQNGKWDGDFEAEGFVTLDRAADITGKLYALDSNGIQLPNQVAHFDIKGHRTGKLTGLYHIIHNDKAVTAVLEVYYKGALIGTKRVTKVPNVNPKVLAIDIDVTQDKKPGYWDGDLEAEGFITLDRPTDITGKLYALDSNGNQMPGQVAYFNIPGHQAGKLTGLYNIIHNDKPVTTVLEVYYNGALLATKRVTKAPIINPKVLAINLDVLHEFQNGKWDGDFEAEGFITLDRPTDITGELYAMDTNRNLLPGQHTQFAINGHQAGKLTGLYHIIHNDRPVICVLKVYNKGVLIAEKEVLKYPRT